MNCNEQMEISSLRMSRFFRECYSHCDMFAYLHNKIPNGNLCILASMSDVSANAIVVVSANVKYSKIGGTIFKTDCFEVRLVASVLFIIRPLP